MARGQMVEAVRGPSLTATVRGSCAAAQHWFPAKGGIVALIMLPLAPPPPSSLPVPCPESVNS
jgi:hypothetical protein